MIDGKPEEEKVKALIEEYEKQYGDLGHHERNTLHAFIFWLYEKKEYMIVPQDFPEGCEDYISDVHLK